MELHCKIYITLLFNKHNVFLHYQTLHIVIISKKQIVQEKENIPKLTQLITSEICNYQNSYLHVYIVGKN